MDETCRLWQGEGYGGCEDDVAVFPEQMDKLDLEDSVGSLQRIENYIRYMTERMEFASSRTTQTVTEAGVSTVGLYQAVMTLADTVAALQANLGLISGRLTEIGGQIQTVNTSLGSLTEQVTALEQQAAQLAQQTAALDVKVTALDGRVTALEEPKA